jgi:Planctomycete cytochrome C/WD domain, G-beta repeat
MPVLPKTIPASRSRAVVLAATAILTAAFAAACAARTARTGNASAPRAVAYAEVQAILRDNCEHCHNEDKAKGGLLMGSYETLIAGGEHGTAVVPGESGSSRLMQMIEGRLTPRMPYKEDPLPRSDVEVIRRWIDEGAPPPGAKDGAPRVEFTVPDIKPTVPVAGAIAAVAFDPAARWMAVGSYKSVRLMTLADRKWSAPLAGHADLVRALAFSPDGRRLAVAGGPAGRFGEIKIWDVQARAPKLVTTIQGHTDTILAIAFSPDGATIASAGYDKLIKLWEVTTGKLVTTLKEHSDAVFAVVFMPGGRTLASAAGDRTLKIWDVSTGKRLLTINDALDSLYAIAVDSSGSRIAAAGADRMIRIWAVDTGSLLMSTFAHADAVLRLAYSPDGSTLVSAGADRVIKLWDAATLREKQVLEAQPDWIMGLALSADGKWLAAGRYDGTLGLYTLAASGPGEQFIVPR